MKKTAATLLALSPAIAGATEFEKPVRMMAGGEVVRVEAPGYAAPCWQDIDGDGHKDLLVGQFNSGKIQVHKGDGSGKLAAGEWLKTGDKIAEVPGVW